MPKKAIHDKTGEVTTITLIRAKAKNTRVYGRRPNVRSWSERAMADASSPHHSVDLVPEACDDGPVALTPPRQEVFLQFQWSERNG